MPMTDSAEDARPPAEPRPRRNQRPRDELGRPMPYGTEGGVEGQPPMPDYLPADALVEAQRLLDDGRPFHAHEVLEDTWKLAPDGHRDFWQGLAQIAVGITHSMRGNPRGASTLIERGAARVGAYSGERFGVDVDGLLAWAERALGELAGGGSAEVSVPRLYSAPDPAE
jgi:hypothetical protein